MTWFLFMLGVLSTYRLSLMISKESGPAFIFRKLRRVPPKSSSLKEGVSCQWCVSIWVAAPVTVFFWWRDFIPAVEMPLYWLSTSAGAVICNQAWTKG